MNSHLVLQSLMTALTYHQPEDHIAFLQRCLEEAKHCGGEYAWDTFLSAGGAGQPHGETDHSREPPTSKPVESTATHATVSESPGVEKMTSKPIIFVLGVCSQCCYKVNPLQW